MVIGHRLGLQRIQLELGISPHLNLIPLIEPNHCILNQEQPHIVIQLVIPSQSRPHNRHSLLPSEHPQISQPMPHPLNDHIIDISRPTLERIANFLYITPNIPI